MNKLAIFLCFLFFCGLFTGCSKEDAKFRLTSRERARIDTLYTQAIYTISAEMDSLCEAQHDEQVRHAVDSILVVRKKEEEMLRERFQKRNRETE